MWTFLRLIWLGILVVIIGLLIPQHFTSPVAGSTQYDYHPQSFWFFPWGKSITHKGVDIFADKGTPICPSTRGIVVFTGQLPRGGKVMYLLGPKWRLHYYAHLEEVLVYQGQWINKDKMIATVGNSGNAQGKAPHLHYSITTLIPYIWRADCSRQGWKKVYYLNPLEELNAFFGVKTK